MRLFSFYFSCILLLLCFFPWMSFGQGLNPLFLSSTVRISYNEIAGSGFLIVKQATPDPKDWRFFLITNRHVLPAEGKEQSIDVRVMVEDSPGKTHVETIPIPVVGSDKRYLATVKKHPIDDIAAIEVTQQVHEKRIGSVEISYDLLADNEKMKSAKINTGDEVFILGYPNALIYDPQNTSPILRSGVIATSPSDGYWLTQMSPCSQKLSPVTRLDAFLIDADILPGSSGSLVILKQQPFTLDLQTGNIGIGASRPYVLGIVTGYIPMSDPDLNVLKENTHLGFVFSAQGIKETISQFYH